MPVTGAGGGTIIGSAQVAQAPADGHTLLLISNSFVINAKLRGEALPYRGMKAFEPVACLTNSPQLLAVNDASPLRSFKDWMDAAKAQPGTITYVTVGPATTQHIAGEMLLRQAGLRMVYVPFGGGAPSDAVARIADAAAVTLAEADIRKRLVELGLEPYSMDPARFARHLDDQYAQYARVIDEVGIKA